MFNATFYGILLTPEFNTNSNLFLSHAVFTIQLGDIYTMKISRRHKIVLRLTGSADKNHLYPNQSNR